MIKRSIKFVRGGGLLSMSKSKLQQKLFNSHIHKQNISTSPNNTNYTNKLRKLINKKSNKTYNNTYNNTSNYKTRILQAKKNKFLKIIMNLLKIKLLK